MTDASVEMGSVRSILREKNISDLAAARKLNYL